MSGRISQGVIYILHMPIITHFINKVNTYDIYYIIHINYRQQVSVTYILKQNTPTNLRGVLSCSRFDLCLIHFIQPNFLNSLYTNPATGQHPEDGFGSGITIVIGSGSGTWSGPTTGSNSTVVIPSP